MDIRDEIIKYFEKTPVPSEILPDKVSSFVKPKFAEKKSMPASSEEAAPRGSAGDAANTGKFADVKPAAEERISADAPAFKEETDAKASDFIKVVFHHKLTGKEFLSILGNSKISNKAYQEIENNPGLTVKRLIEILEESPLTSEDYQRLIIATERAAALKRETQSKISSEPSKSEASSPIVPPVSSKNKVDLTRLTAPKTMEMPPPVSPKTNRIGPLPANVDEEAEKESEDFEEEEKEKKSRGVKLKFGLNRSDDDIDDIDDEDDEDDDEDDDDNEEYGKKRKKNKKSRSKKLKLGAGRNDDDIDDDEDYEDGEKDEDDEDEYDDDEYRPKKRSNKGKFVAAAISAAALIAISFGIRYYFTGSLLPIKQSDTEEVTLNEQGIYNALHALPSQQISDFSEEQTYTVGGVGTREVLKNIVTADKRLLYIRENSIYIFELIGGQLRQLEVRKYNEGITILGMMETNQGIAVITSYEGDNYTYSYVQPSENPEETGTEVSGSVKRPETVIELLNSDTPENRSLISVIKLSGSLSAIYKDSGSRLIAVTSENFPEGAAAGDANTFMPYSVIGNDKKLCSAENILITDKPSYGTFSAVFSVELGGSVDIAGAAGGAVKASRLQSGTLYVGHSNVLAEFDLLQAPAVKQSCVIDGSFEDFSEIGVFDGEIRVTSLLNGAASLMVFDGELKKNSEINNLGNGEVPVATCFNGKDTFVVTETGTCYGIDAENNVISESSLKVTDSKVYPLNETMGLKITPTDDGGKRTGITVSTVKLDGTLSEIGSTVISSLTVAQNSLDEYLSSPAETDIYTIGSQLNEDGSGFLTVPVVYFDGVSEVELFVIYSVNSDGILSVCGDVTDYDRRSKTILSAVKNGFVIAITDGRITTARSEDGSVVGYFDVNSSGTEYGY